MHEIKAGSTDQTIRFMLTKSDGTPYTGLLYSTPGLKCYYSRQGAASSQITLVDIPNVGTYVSSGFKAVDGTNMPGYYELGIPDAAIAAGAKFVDIMISGPADLYVCPQRVRLTGIDLDDATAAGLSTITRIDTDLAAYYGSVIDDSTGYLKAKMYKIESDARVELAGELWGNYDISAFDSLGTDVAAGRLKAILDKTDALPESPAAIGSPMTLADGAITAAKLASNALADQPVASVAQIVSPVQLVDGAITDTTFAPGAITGAVVADGALTSEKVPSVGSVVGNIGGSVNNVISGVDLSSSALAAVEQSVSDSADAALGSVASDIAALNSLVSRMMGPGEILIQFPVFKGPRPSTEPNEGVTVWLTEDEEGEIVYAGPQLSDSNGITRWMVSNNTTYYAWCQKSKQAFSNPTTIEVNV